MRKLPIPLKCSNKVLPKLASLWNRSKNGSDVATGVMRGAWYPLPIGARSPQALVIQHFFLNASEYNENFEYAIVQMQRNS